MVKLHKLVEESPIFSSSFADRRAAWRVELGFAVSGQQQWRAAQGDRVNGVGTTINLLKNPPFLKS